MPCAITSRECEVFKPYHFIGPCCRSLSSSVGNHSGFLSLTAWRADGVVGCGRCGSVLQVKVPRRRSPDAMPPLSPASKYALLRARRGIGGMVSCVAGSTRACPSPTTRHLGPAQVQSTNENRRWLPHRRKGCAHRLHAGVDRDRAQAAVRPPGGAGACSDVTGAGPLGPRTS